ncbi:MAG: hypothetical protein AB7F97_06015 [Solirubrobacterales bacterium]
MIGCGALGMAFADTLVEETDAEVVMVDRRHAPGGHWLNAYPFVRLHQPSRYYGVNSTPLGGESRLADGPEAGMYERASAAEICAYYDRVMRERLIPSGQVRFFPQCEHLGGGRFASRLTGEEFEVGVGKRIVDARYLPAAIPAESPPSFEVEPGVSCLTPGDLVDLAHHPDGYVVVGGGKTAIDTCLWLLENGVSPEAIRWIKPREAWLLNRRYFQPGDLIGDFLAGISLQMEAAAGATSADDLFDRLEAAGQLRRVDPDVRPTMHKGATISDWEIDLLRGIQAVERRGHVRAIEADRIVFDEGAVPTSPGHVHVHCTAPGLARPPILPVFDEGLITLQPIRLGLPPFAAALTAFVEAHRDEEAEKNRLCPPTRYPDTDLDWARATLNGMSADYAWSREPDIFAWLDRSRLNPTSGLIGRSGEPEVQGAVQRFVENVRPGLGRLAELVG